MSSLVFRFSRAETGGVPRPAARLLLVGLSLVLAVFGVLAHPARAAACDCSGLTTARAYRQADAVFAGTVTRLNRVRRGDDVALDIRFDVLGVYKGTAYAQQVVASPVDAPGCGLRPEVGEPWVIFAIEGVEGTGDRAVSRLVTTQCSGNLPTATVPTLLGPPRRPAAGPSDRDERSAEADQTLTRGLGLLGLGVLTFGVAGAVVLVALWRPGRRR